MSMPMFDAVRRRLDSAVRVEEPFPHVLVDRLLPQAFYEQLDAHWPPISAFRGERDSGKLDLVPVPAGIEIDDPRTQTYMELPMETRSVWDQFVLQVNREIIGPFLERMFAPEIAERLRLLAALPDDDDVADYLRPPFEPRMNVGRFMMRSAGYRLKPHLDAPAYLATALYYFPREHDDPATEGTTLFRAAAAIATCDILERRRTLYFHKTGIETTPALTAPFVGNALLAFPNTGHSAHGMTISSPGWRRSFQCHLSLKSDEDHL
jgi:hypothetical protein